MLYQTAKVSAWDVARDSRLHNFTSTVIDMSLLNSTPPNTHELKRADMTLVSILNWNGTTETLECLSALDRSNAPELHFVVLDNGSAEDPAALLSRVWPAVEYIRLSKNRGFTGGHNYVMKMALERGYGSILLLNNDCKIKLADIRHMRESMAQDPLVAAVSPLIYRDDESKKPMMVAGWLDWALHRSVRPNSPDAIQPAGSPTMLVGTALLLRSEALTKIGLLDDRYFAYYEDNDISARISQHGYRAVYCQSATCMHDYRKLNQYSPMALYLLTRNAWLFWKRHTPNEHCAGLRRTLFAGALYDLASLQKNAAPDEKRRALIDGLWDGLHGVEGNPTRSKSAPVWFRIAVEVRPYFFHRLIKRLSGSSVTTSSTK